MGLRSNGCTASGLGAREVGAGRALGTGPPAVTEPKSEEDLDIGNRTQGWAAPQSLLYSRRIPVQSFESIFLPFTIRAPLTTPSYSK